MGEKVRRVRLLVAVGVAGLVAFVGAWPSEGAATETPAPLYLARDRDAAWTDAGTDSYVAVGSHSELLNHLLVDGEDIAELEIVDGAGRVVVLHPNGDITPTGDHSEPATLQAWLHGVFSARQRALDSTVRGSGICQSRKQWALQQLHLPIQQDGRDLTFAETLVEADARLADMHRPESRLPAACVPPVHNTGHPAGYLHNLWHRVTGTDRPAG